MGGFALEFNDGPGRHEDNDSNDNNNDNSSNDYNVNNDIDDIDDSYDSDNGNNSGTNTSTQGLDKVENFFPGMQLGEAPRKRLVLTPAALRFLVDEGFRELIPTPSKEAIEDKSKGSSFTKALVCIQGT